jgi:multidrug resistance efflux pump
MHNGNVIQGECPVNSKIAKRVILALVSGAFSFPAFAQRTESTTSPYIQLYAANWAQAKLEIDVARITLANETRLLERYRPLVAKGFLSQQKFEEQSIKVEVAKLEVDNLVARAAQAQSLYEVNKLRIENGLDVPVCPEGD